MKNVIWILGLSTFLTAASSARPQTEGKFGSVRYTLKDARLPNQAQNSELLSLTGDTAEFVAPLNSLDELDRLALLSHQATSLCGSLDYYPPGYTLADTVTHSQSFFPAELHFPKLATLIEAADINKMNETLTTLTALSSRFHRHSVGQNAGATVKQIWNNNIIRSDQWALEEVTHSVTPQKSVVAKIAGDSPETAILGAHLDSINSVGGVTANAPGADDDGSGIAIITEILRIVEANSMRFHRNIELHAYAAEEIGLVGSRALAKQYKTEGKTIAGMLQFDMAYYSRAADMGRLFFLEDFTSLDLMRNGIRLTKSYLGDVYQRGVLPAGSASDHKSWFEQGYPTLFPFENPEADNPFIHSLDDSLDQLNDSTRMKRMVQLGLLFLVYQAGWTALDAEAPGEIEKLRKAPVARDFFLSLSGSAGSYSLAASTTGNAAYTEFCKVTAASDFRCAGTRRKLSEERIQGERKIFSSRDVFAFAKGESYRVEIFDNADVLLARRHITLE